MTARGTGRRRFLSGLAATTALPLVAGCLGDTDEDDADEPVVDAAETTATDTDPDRWTDVTEIRFDGWVGGWVGVAPEPIDRVENPTLVLVAGREYELAWENMDGVHHNVAFWDENHDVIRDYSTPGNEIEGEIEGLRFEATPEMETYRCEYQQARQRGDVIVLDPE